MKAELLQFLSVGPGGHLHIYRDEDALRRVREETEKAKAEGRHCVIHLRPNTKIRDGEAGRSPSP